MFKSYSRINIAQVLRVVGMLMAVESLFMLVPLLTSLYYGEIHEMWTFLNTMVVGITLGVGMMLLIRPKRTDMSKRDGFLLTSLVWIAFSLLGMLPFLWCDLNLNISDSFFEAMSGFTTTGASVLDVDKLPRGIIIWRCLMQWIGGMGIILFTLAILPMLNHSGGIQMFNAEVTGITHDKLRPRISQTAKSLWFVYFVLSIMLFGLLWAGPMDCFDAVCHAFSTMSTGGFSSRQASIGAWDSNYIDIVLIIFMFLGGVNFGLIYKAAIGQFKEVRRNDALRLYASVTVIMFLLFVICIFANGQFHGWDSVTIDPLFQVVSTITSTGYTVNNFEMWGGTVIAFVFFMMFFGACAGSTSGGAKIDRLNYLMRFQHNETLRALNPNTIYTIRVNGKVVSSEMLAKVMAFLCIYLMAIVVSGTLLTMLGIPLVDAYFSAFSCMSNTGLGAGVTGYGGSYDVIPAAGKWILSFVMLVGRLEIFTIAVLFTKSFWRR